jgi:hypothetical protein
LYWLGTSAAAAAIGAIANAANALRDFLVMLSSPVNSLMKLSRELAGHVAPLLVAQVPADLDLAAV